MVDTAVAKRAGIGFIGKNGLVISKEYGSYMYLGELITNLEIEPDHEVDYGCGDCRVVVWMPVRHLVLSVMDYECSRCLSFQTQDKGNRWIWSFEEDKDCYLWLGHLSDFVHITKVFDNPLASDIDP